MHLVQLCKVGTHRRLGFAILLSGSASPDTFSHREVEPESPQHGSCVQGEQFNRTMTVTTHLDWNTILR